MVDDCPHEFTCPCPAQQSIQIDVANPPENKGMRFTAELGPAEEDDVE